MALVNDNYPSLLLRRSAFSSEQEYRELLSLFQSVKEMQRTLVEAINTLDNRVMVGTGSPEGVVTASPGTLYLNQSGGSGTTLYVKEGGTGNTGWVAK